MAAEKQVYVQVGGEENGKAWFSEQEAEHVGDILQHIVEVFTTNDRAIMLEVLREHFGAAKVPDYLFRNEPQ